MMQKVILVAVLALAVGACVTAGKGKSSYEELYTRAQSEIRIAQQMGFLWRDTKKILARSKRAHELGDKDEAMKLATEALRQARLAQEQAKEQANPQIIYPPI